MLPNFIWSNPCVQKYPLWDQKGLLHGSWCSTINIWTNRGQESWTTEWWMKQYFSIYDLKSPNMEQSCSTFCSQTIKLDFGHTKTYSFFDNQVLYTFHSKLWCMWHQFRNHAETSVNIITVHQELSQHRFCCYCHWVELCLDSYHRNQTPQTQVWTEFTPRSNYDIIF